VDEMNEPQASGSATASVDADGRTIVVVSGEFDVSNADVLRKALDDTESSQPVVIDARELRFVDSSGLAVLLQCAERTGPIEIRDAPPVLHRIVEISGLADVLRLV